MDKHLRGKNDFGKWNIGRLCMMLITLLLAGGAYNQGLSDAPAAPVITSSDTATFSACSIGSFTLTFTGNPAPTLGILQTYNIPIGIFWDSATGTLSGTPRWDTVGKHTFTIFATNGVSPDYQQNFTLIVNPGLSLGSTSQGFDSSGGTGKVDVINPCNRCGTWTAVSDVAWITNVTITCTSGKQQISYKVAPNNGPARTGTFTFESIKFTVTQTADEAEFFVPVIVSTAGLNESFYTSEFILTNRGGRNATAQLTYTESLQTGQPGGTANVTVPAGQQVIAKDAIAFLKQQGVPIAEGNSGGTLRVHFSSLAHPGDGAVAVRTSSLVSDGRAGLAYGGIPLNGALEFPSYICGLRETEQDRSNLALQNAGTAQEGIIILRVTIFSDKGVQAAVLPDIVLNPGAFTQITQILHSSGLALDSGYVRIEPVGGTAPYYAYGVINDTHNGDGSFLPPQLDKVLDRFTATLGFTLPVLVESARYNSELMITNWSTESRTLHLSFMADGIQTADHTIQPTMTLAPGEQQIIPDVIQYWRGKGILGIPPRGTTLAGSLTLSTPGGYNWGLNVGARTSSPDTMSDGQFGVYYPAISSLSTLTNDGWLIGLQQDTESRTNLAFVNTGGVDATADDLVIDLFDGATGKLAATTTVLGLKPYAWIQIDSILKKYCPTVLQGYAHVQRLNGKNPFIAYAIINDGAEPGQGTGDGAYVPISQSQQ